MRTSHCTLLLALFAAAAAHGADVYRTRAADGTITYTDRPQNDNSEVVPVNVPRPTTVSQPRPRADASTSDNAAAETSTAPQLPADGPTAAELRAQRKKNCDVARELFDRMTISPRLYRTNAAGEREYLNEQEATEARAKAQSDVKEWCG